jgi:hypothetical protein
VLGIALLVAMLDAARASNPVGGFLDAYVLMAAGGLVAAALALTLGRVPAIGTAGAAVEAPA